MIPQRKGTPSWSRPTNRQGRGRRSTRWRAEAGVPEGGRRHGGQRSVSMMARGAVLARAPARAAQRGLKPVATIKAFATRASTRDRRMVPAPASRRARERRVEGGRRRPDGDQRGVRGVSFADNKEWAGHREVNVRAAQSRSGIPSGRRARMLVTLLHEMGRRKRRRASRRCASAAARVSRSRSNASFTLELFAARRRSRLTLHKTSS